MVVDPNDLSPSTRRVLITLDLGGMGDGGDGIDILKYPSTPNMVIDTPLNLIYNRPEYIMGIWHFNQFVHTDLPEDIVCHPEGRI